MANKVLKEVRTSLRLDASDASMLHDLGKTMGMKHADVLRALLRSAHKRMAGAAKLEIDAIKKNVLGEV